MREIDGSIKLSTKREESKHGADVLLTLTDGNPKRPERSDKGLRFFFQAKRVRNLDEWHGQDRNFRAGSKQINDLISAAAEHEAKPYYLLYVQAEDAHEAVAGRCTVHTSPQDCAAMLVDAQTVEDYFESDERNEPRALLKLGTPLRCLPADCLGREKAATVIERSAAFARTHKPASQSYSSPNPGEIGDASAIVINPSMFRRTDTDDSRVHGEAIVLLLGAAEANHEGYADGLGTNRRGSGWSPDYSATDLKEAARQWWVVSSDRARTIRFLVAVGDWKVRACYAITGAEQVAGGRFEFEVDELDQGSTTARRLRASTRTLLQTRKRGARNPVTYVNV